jgi:hypothetical protein
MPLRYRFYNINSKSNIGAIEGKVRCAAPALNGFATQALMRIMEAFFLKINHYRDVLVQVPFSFFHQTNLILYFYVCVVFCMLYPLNITKEMASGV